jgi:nitrate reductase delta subunit
VTGRGSRTPEELLLASGLTVDELRATWLAGSWLLSYPDAAMLERTGQLRRLVASLPDLVKESLTRTLDAFAAADHLELAEQYVDTFDTRRRGCLYLTYFSQGDTRRRGMALVRIKQDFRAAGVEVGDEELPDHLPLVLEFAAAHDATRGAKILRQNRPGLELLRLHLEEISAPWHGAVRAISATLPRLDADDRAAVVKLAQEGPEEETVGLDGYGAEVDTLDPDSLAGAAAMLAARSGEACGGHLPGAGGGPVPVELTTRGHGR